MKGMGLAGLSGVSRGIGSGRWWGVAVIFVLVTWFWFPALSGERIIIHGDSAHHGLSLVIQLSQILKGNASLLWDSHLYGGHPIHAESQGAFLNPLNVLVVYLFEPILAGNILHWLAMLVGAMGGYCLARQLDIRPWLATFAALGVAFSPSVLSFQSNYTVSSTLMWMPWLLVALEYWLKSPTIARGTLLAWPVALMVLSGYPQLTHGVVLYAFVSLMAMPLQREGRSLLRGAWKKMLLSGSLAMLLAVGLCMVQLLPLLELAGESHRGEGIQLPWYIPLEYVLRGAIYFYSGADKAAANVGSIGSAAFLLLAFSALLMRVPHRILGHIFGAFLLLNLGVQDASPIFGFLYENNLVPGLHFYRAMHLFLPVAVVGIGVLAAFSLERAICFFETRENIFWMSFRLALLVLLGAWSFAVYLLFVRDVGIPAISALAALVVLLGLPVFAVRGLSSVWTPLVLVLLAVVEISSNRMIFTFHPRSILAEPETFAVVKQAPDWQEYKAMMLTGAGGYVFLPASSTGLENAYRYFMASFAPMPTAKAGIASFNGTLALQLARRELLTEHIDQELKMTQVDSLGWRLVDILSIKYVATRPKQQAPGFRLLFKDPRTGVMIHENTAAKPRFQFYERATAVTDMQAALAALKASPHDALLVESSQVVVDEGCQVEPDFHYSVGKDTSTDYVLRVQSACAGWLFFADANYPGWKAWVNGQPADVLSAQVLGKAIRIPAGEVDVRFEFVSRSFQVGAIVSAISLLLVLFLAVAGLLRRRRA